MAVGSAFTGCGLGLVIYKSITSFSLVLLTSCVGYHAGKPKESVVYCLNIS